jgi:photosynthetic reaction center H subunit
MVDGVGPAAWAIRPDVPDLTHEGEARIVPTRVATDYTVSPRDPDPRGQPVYGADGEIGGEVTDLWVDRGEPCIRYLEIATRPEGEEGLSRRVLLPINFTRVARDGSVRVNAILGRHFAKVPGTASLDQITLQEEDRVCAFYGGGTLYALPERGEPLL